MYKPRPAKVRAQIVAMKPTHTALQIATKFGITRNAVIAIWFRANAPPLSREERIWRQTLAQQRRWQS